MEGIRGRPILGAELLPGAKLLRKGRFLHAKSLSKSRTRARRRAEPASAGFPARAARGRQGAAPPVPVRGPCGGLPVRLSLPAEPGAQRRGRRRAGQPAPPADEGAAADAAFGEADGLLLLVNPWTPLPEDFVPGELVPVQNDQAVDARAYPDLQDMLQDMSQAGLSPLICSSYRSQERQQELYDNKVQRVMDEGVSWRRRRRRPRAGSPGPGTSEHQTGLAVDIVSLSNQMLDETQESTPEFQWLAENAWKYGFILRYPNDKSEKTGIAYEPWHFRFVGKEAAEEMHDLGLCLEEYLESLAD